jgi:hypothetical protein
MLPVRAKAMGKAMARIKKADFSGIGSADNTTILST